MYISVIRCKHVGAAHANCKTKFEHALADTGIGGHGIAECHAGRAHSLGRMLTEMVEETLQTSRIKSSAATADASSAATHTLDVGMPPHTGEQVADMRYADGVFASRLNSHEPGFVMAGRSTALIDTAARFAPAPLTAKLPSKNILDGRNVPNQRRGGEQGGTTRESADTGD